MMFAKIFIILYSIIAITAETNTDKIILDTDDCGTRKNCYISPNDCDVKRDNCIFVLKWDFDGEYINYDLKAVTSDWINIVFSDDKAAGNDNVVVCKRYGQDTDISITHYYRSKADSELVKLQSEQDGLFKKHGRYYNGHIHCAFSRTKVSGFKNVNNLNKAHYLHVGTGNSDESFSDSISPKKSMLMSENSIEFYTINKAPTKTSWLVKFHAVIMISAWILLASLGILIARYYRTMWPNHVLFNRVRVWFSYHMSLMVTVLALTLLGFLLILIHMGFTWSKDGMEFVHSILGIIVISCSVLNPLLALCRPKPDTRLRCLFFWIHWLIGTIAFCLSVPNVFIGMDLRKIDVPNWCSWLLFAWVIFYIIVEIILEIHYCCTFHKYDQKYNEYTTIDKNRIVLKARNPPGYRWKPTLLFVYAAVTAIVVSAIVIAILIKDFF